MDSYKIIGEAILKELFNHNCKESLDDAEYIPIVKAIINGIGKSMNFSKPEKQEINTVKNNLKKFNRELYTNLWLKNAKEDEADKIDIKKEKECAIYYFDYIYKHGEHPH